MNKIVRFSIIFFWIFLVMCTFWVHFPEYFGLKMPMVSFKVLSRIISVPTGLPEISGRFLSLTPFWAMSLFLLFLSLALYVVYNTRSQGGKEITFHVRPLTFILWVIFFTPLLFFIEYGQQIGYYTSLFTELGVPSKDLLSRLAGYLSIKDSSLFALDGVGVKFLEKYVMSLVALMVLFGMCLGLGSTLRKLLQGFALSQRIFLQTIIGAAFLSLLLLFIAWSGAFQGIVLWGLASVLVLVAIIFEGPALWEHCSKKHSYTLSKIEGFGYFVTYALGILLVSLSLLHVIRPMPIGWDDITLYMNLPSLTTQYGHLVSGFGTYNWGLVMAMGMSLFGEARFAMLYSFAGGLLAFWGILVLLSSQQDEEKPSLLPLLLTLVFVAAPFFQFQFAEDMKVDLALTAMGAGALLLTMDLMKEREEKGKYGILVVLGVLLGVMLGVKFTTLLFIYFIGVLLAWKYGKGILVGAVSAFFLSLLFLANVLRFGGLSYPEGLLIPTGIFFFLMGGALLALWIFRRRREGIQALLFLALFSITSFLAFSPWLVHNTLSFCEVGRPCTFSGLNSALFGKVQTPVLLPKTVTNSPEINVQESASGARLKELLVGEGGGQKEELQRYRGFDSGLFSFVSLPVDVTFGLNERGDYITIGWIFLAFFPLLCFGYALVHEEKEKKLLMALLPFILFALALLFGFGKDLHISFLPLVPGSLWTLFTTMAVLGALFFLWKKYGKEENASPLWSILFPATLLYWFAWMYLASGVIWYGILGFLPLLMLIQRVLLSLEEKEKEWYKLFVVLMIVGWIIPMYFYKFTLNEVQVPTQGRTWEKIVSYCTPSTREEYQEVIRQVVRAEADQEALIKACALYEQKMISSRDFETAVKTGVAEVRGKLYGMFESFSFMLYKAGILNTEEEVMRQMNPPYADAIKMIREADPSIKIYRVGTFIPYYTPFNDKRLLHDNQLDIFISHYLPEMDGEAFVKNLKDSGFGYIVYDNRTETIDRTPEKTLTKKVELFKTFLKSQKNLEIVIGTGDDADAFWIYKIL